MFKFFDVFRAGKYPQGIFSAKDVETLAANYDPSFCEAPITLDHEQKGPAYGWVSGLKAENGKLKASFRDVAPELKDFVQLGKYKKISVEIYRELEGKKPYLKAVSFLGAAIPQVKGMDPVEFKEAESDVYVFEYEEEDFKSEIAKLSEQIKEIEAQIQTFSEQTDKNKGLDLLQGLIDKIQSFKDQISKFQSIDTARQKAEDELAKLKQQVKRSEFEQFLTEQITSGNLTPSQKEFSLNTLLALDSVAKFEEKDPVEDFKTFIKSLPKQVEFDEFATKNKQDKKEPDVEVFENASEESLEVYKEVRTLAEKENIPFKDALLKLYK